jgi:hypothetical protein
MTIKLSTTGTLSPVVIEDLDYIEFVHPVVNCELINETFGFTIARIRTSADLQFAVDMGYIILRNDDGNPIGELSVITEVNLGVNMPTEVALELEKYILDSFGRWRTSSPVFQMGISQDHPAFTRLITEGQVSGSGTSSSYSANRSSTTLTVGTQVGLRRFRSKHCGLYQPAKSLVLFATFVFGTGQADVIKRVGLFDTKDGVYLRQNGTQPEWVLRKSVSGSVQHTYVTRSNWSYDKLDGSGPSGYNVDFTKAQIVAFAIEWLGVGNVFCFVVIDGKPRLSHVFQHFNQLSSVYMRSARLFITYEIERAVSGGTAESFEAICSGLINEGSIERCGINYSITRASGNDFNTSLKNNARTLILFRLNPSYINSQVFITKVGILMDTSDFFYLYIVEDPDLNGYNPVWTSHPNSSIQYDANPPSTISVSNYLSNNIWADNGGKNADMASSDIHSLDALGVKFDDTPYIYALTIIVNGDNEKVRNAIVSFMEQI